MRETRCPFSRTWIPGTSVKSFSIQLDHYYKERKASSASPAHVAFSASYLAGKSQMYILTKNIASANPYRVAAAPFTHALFPTRLGKYARIEATHGAHADEPNRGLLVHGRGRRHVWLRRHLWGAKASVYVHSRIS